MTSDPTGPPAGRSFPTVAELAQRLPPGAFSFVMATGVISTAIRLVGQPALSVALLWTAAAGAAALFLLLGIRLIRFPRAVLADARDPEKAFGLFTVVAALIVLSVRLDLAGDAGASVVLAAASVPIWLIVGYGTRCPSASPPASDG